jgi:hypothetical protein
MGNPIRVSWALLFSLSSLAFGCGGGGNDNSQQQGNDSGTEAGNDAATPGWNDTGLDNNSIEAIAVDTKTPTTIFVGNGAGGAKDAGLYRSKDSGQSWAQLTNGIPASGCHAVAVSSSNGTVIASAGISTYFSQNGGDSFTVSTGDPGGVNTLIFDASGSKAFTVSAQKGMYVSADAGATWGNISSTGLPALNTVDLGPLATDGQNLYLGSGGQGVYVSADAGATFTGPGTGMPQAFADTINALAASAARPGVVFALTNADGLYRSDDSGASWSKVSTSGPTRYAALLIDKLQPKTFYVGLDETQGGAGGLDSSSDDGKTWAPFGPPTAPVSVVDQDPVSGAIYAGTVGQGVWRYGN